ncbi:hypothetical protein AB6A40_002748 [Gnathostoma spinigerum]|uniref:F-box domain-containing protein n=1 Tax=Gnathostoma spinigerum TaxID=75299 RepID=A0ABD6EFA8_9BILA
MSESPVERLPTELFHKILQFLSYETLSNIRLVSKSFDAAAKCILNAAFFRLTGELETAMSNVKKLLPKRESRRRYHPLNRVSEAYSSLETRCALLGMTFGKHIVNDTCCFIAGKVLDEAYSVLHTLNNCVKHNEKPKETQELLRDIRDYSSMAIEYFDETISPSLTRKHPSPLRPTYCSTDYVKPNSPSTSNVNIPTSDSVLTDVSKLMEWRKWAEEKMKWQERRINEQNMLINDIIDFMREVSQKIPLENMKNWKYLSVQRTFVPGAGPSPGRTESIDTAASSSRKRKADIVLDHLYKNTSSSGKLRYMER